MWPQAPPHCDRAPPRRHALVAVGERSTLLAGSSRALCAWCVTPRVPPVCAGAPGELGERVRRHRAQRALPPHDTSEPDEQSVRALCTVPEYECALDAPLVGLELHPSARWVCAVCADGSVLCVCTRTLHVLWAWRAIDPPPAPPPMPLHYVQPAASDAYVTSPVGAHSSCVCVLSVRSGAVRVCGAAGAALCALVTREDTLLVLTADAIHEWRERATTQCATEPSPHG